MYIYRGCRLDESFAPLDVDTGILFISKAERHVEHADALSQ
jgi:hypothetical protein